MQSTLPHFTHHAMTATWTPAISTGSDNAWLGRLRCQLLAAALPYLLGHAVAGGWLKLSGVFWSGQGPIVFFLLGTVLLAWAASTVENALGKNEVYVPPQSAVYMAEGALLALTPLFWLALRLA
jgi:hypothetical protein